MFNLKQKTKSKEPNKAPLFKLKSNTLDNPQKTVHR